MPSYYTKDTNFVNSMYSLDISVEKYLKDLLFPFDHDLSRIVYASNDYSFRERSNKNNGNLNLPYVNYKLKQGGFQFNNDANWRNSRAYTDGVFLDGVGVKAKIIPVIFEYECTFWSNRDDEVKYAGLNVSFDQGTTSNPIDYQVQINNQTVPLLGKLYFDSNEIDGNFTEKDWLEKNQIHSLSMDFNVKTFILKVDNAVSITEKIIFEFTTQHGVDESFTDEERYNFVIDRFSDEVVPE